jgi:hypothetical protein
MIRKPQPQLIEAQWELVRRLPAPRHVRSRVGTRILYGIILSISIVAPAVIGGFLAKNYFERESLRSRGVSTTGRILHARTKTSGSRGSKSTSTIVEHDFMVDGRSYRFETDLPGAVHVAKGPTEVVYLPEDPRRATSRSYLSLPFHKTQSALLMISGVCLILIFGPGGWILTRSFRRHGRLLARGLPAVATIDAVAKTSKGAMKVDYVFRAGGTLRQGSVVVDGPAVAKTEPGRRLAMLYDPADSRCTDLFFAAVASYLIVEPRQRQAAT